MWPFWKKKKQCVNVLIRLDLYLRIYKEFPARSPSNFQNSFEMGVSRIIERKKMLICKYDNVEH